MKDKNTNHNNDELLTEIRNAVKAIIDRNKFLDSENGNYERLKHHWELYHLQQIDDTFNRILDKVFQFNNILIAIYIFLCTFPVKEPVLELWSIMFPITTLIYLILVEGRQVSVHGTHADEMRKKNPKVKKMMRTERIQAFLSVFGLLLSLGCLAYIISQLV
jgi:hypothetical protein